MNLELKDGELKVFKGPCQHWKVVAELNWTNGTKSTAGHSGCFDSADEAAEVGKAFVTELTSNPEFLKKVLNADKLPTMQAPHFVNTTIH